MRGVKVNEKTGEMSYGFASNLRDALPNASFIGLTPSLPPLGRALPNAAHCLCRSAPSSLQSPARPSENGARFQPSAKTGSTDSKQPRSPELLQQAPLALALSGLCPLCHWGTVAKPRSESPGPWFFDFSRWRAN